MFPMKLFLSKNTKQYKKILLVLNNEKSLLGSNFDKEKGFYLIVDKDNSVFVQEYLKWKNNEVQ